MDFFELLKTSGPEAVKKALQAIPGGSSISDLIENAPELLSSGPVQGAAKALSGENISDILPNPGNPIDDITHGVVGGLIGDIKEEPASHGVTREWEEQKPVESSMPSNLSDKKPTEPTPPPPSGAPASVPTSEPKTSLPTQESTADASRREEMQEEEKKKHNLGLLPVTAAGIGDAIGSAASAFGAQGTTGTQDKVIKNLDAGSERNKAEFEKSLLNDPTSDISRQYQTIITKVLDQAGMKVPSGAVAKMSASQIEQQFPQLAKLASTRMEAEGRKGEMKLRQDSLQQERDLRRDERLDQRRTAVVDKFNASPLMRKLDQTRDAASTIIDLVNTNAIGDNAAATFMARASGEVGNLSEADKRPFGGSQALMARIKQAASMMATGRMTDENRQFIIQLVKVMEHRADANKDRHAAEWARQYGTASENMTPEQIYGWLRPGGTLAGTEKAQATPTAKPPLSSFYR